MPHREELPGKNWRLAWTAVFAGNLLVPLILGWLVAGGPAGRVGLVLAVVVYWGLGLAACAGDGRRIRPLLAGGILVGISQLVPLAQIWAGMAALRFWSTISGDPGTYDDMYDPPWPMMRGFALTAATGAILLVLAELIGLAADALFKPRPSGNADSSIPSP